MDPFQQHEQRTSVRSFRTRLAGLLILSVAVGAGLLLLFISTAMAAPSPIRDTFACLQRTFFNSTPTLTYDPAQTTQNGETITGRVAPRDADGDILTLTVSAPVNGGAVVVSPDGAFTYTVPVAMRQSGGADAFTITASDRGAYWHVHGFSRLLNLITRGLSGDAGHDATITVTLTIATVNAAPVAGTPAYTVGAPEPAYGAVQGEVHATDPDLDVLTYTIATGPGKGAVVLNSADGTFTYTPTPAARHDAALVAATPDQLTDTFTVSVDDGHGGAVTVTVSVPIAPANSAPSLSLTIGDPDDGTGAVTVLVTVTDPDLDPIVYEINIDPAYGTVVPTPGGFIYTPSSEAREAAAATSGIDTDTFQVRVSDLHGGVDLETATVVISPLPPV